MTTLTYFVAPDPNGDLHVWSERFAGDEYPRPQVSRADFDTDYLWDKLTDGMEIRP